MSKSTRVAKVVAIGTLDTKGIEYAFLCDRIRELGVDVILIDAGVLGTPSVAPDISRSQVACAAGVDLAELVAAGDRGAAIATMARGAVETVRRLHDQGLLDGIVGLGGTGGSSLISLAMRALPVGIPKLLVSTVASGDTRPYVGPSDLTLMHSVVDIAGINRISARILSNAASAIAGMTQAKIPEVATKPAIAASMFGVTTPCVTIARKHLEKRGYEVLVFHQTGTGGGSLEELVNAGYVVGVLDITTTELCDELVGGVFPAYPTRLEGTSRVSVPRVVSLGALDMVNFGPIDSVPERFRHRTLYVHNASVTLMRTNRDECAELGRRLARKLNKAKGPTALFIPLRGVSAIATEGQPFWDPEADAALLESIHTHLAPHVEVRELDMDINDSAFARGMAERLTEMLGETT
jgi:uncharacterized protein (UPF0261 family)